MKHLLSPDPADGGTPPSSAVIVENSKTERELELEQERDVARSERLSAESRAKKLEVDLSHLQKENGELRQVPKPVAQPAKEKLTWMFYGA